nr:hypothetical protein [Heliomicrobium undosum]
MNPLHISRFAEQFIGRYRPLQVPAGVHDVAGQPGCPVILGFLALTLGLKPAVDEVQQFGQRDRPKLIRGKTKRAEGDLFELVPVGSR